MMTHIARFIGPPKKINKGKDTLKDPSIFITGTTVAVQWEDGELQTLGVIVETNIDDHRGCSYTI